MKHIFITYSNITSLAIYNRISYLKSNNEESILITHRGVNWPFPNLEIPIIDFSNLYRNFYVYRVKSIVDFIKRMLYMHYIKKYTKRIIGREDFILYLSNFEKSYQVLFADSKFCQGYYLVEEGSISYLYKYKMDKYLCRSFLERHKSWIGLTDRFCMEVNNKFRGTISITNYAFEWNIDKEKLVYSEFDIPLLENYKSYENIIVTGHMKEDINSIFEKLNRIISFLQSQHVNNVALKFHPFVYYNTPEKINILMSKFSSSSDFEIVVLPPEYVVEFSIIKAKSNIFSLDTLSSLNIYSVAFGGFSYIYNKKIIKFKNVKSCIDYFYN